MSEHGDASDAASQRSSNTGGSASETSSQRDDSKFLKKRAQGAQADKEDETDLLEQKRNVQEGVFICMYTLVRQTALSGWKWALLRIALEFLTNFRVVFNTHMVWWVIDSRSPVWQVISWTLWRAPLVRLYGYHAYVVVLYLMAAAVLLCVLGLAWLTLAMRKQDQSKWLRTAALVLHVVYDVIFVMCYVAFLDYFTFALNCDFSTGRHSYFADVVCLRMPHLLHMCVGLAAALLFLCVTALMVVASCDLNPVTHDYLASPAAYVRLKILVVTVAFVIITNALPNGSKLQAGGMLGCAVLIVYWNIRTMPFYRTIINAIWTGLWCGIAYTCVIMAILAFGKTHTTEQYRRMTKNVLYGMFPVVLGGMALSSLHSWWAMLPARKFKDIQPGVKLARVHKFESAHEVERLARVMRSFDADGLAVPEAAAFAEIIIKAGMQAFPNSPHLLILYANFLLEARKDGPAARTQLQLAGKAAPNIVEKYQIFCTNEASKRLKDSADGGMDLQAYIEFKRNFRAVLRVHREAVLQQAELWRLCMRASVRVTQMDEAMEVLEAANARAHQVYKRVLERYPSNGKLLRCYGKFLEDCRHDQRAAAAAYGEANRNGGASNSGLLLLDLSGAGVGGGGGKPDFLTSMSIEDDAVVVTDAQGRILMVSQAVQSMFGYAKAEIEGANVSVLMPQPFSQRHPGYMARFVGSGEPHILDSVRQVVALHKERYVFPVALCITKLSGTGVDSVFLGVFRPLAPNLTSQRAWLSPNGVFLCADQHFASSFGFLEGELVGHALSSLVTDPEHAEGLLQRCRDATSEVLESGSIQAHLRLLHRYLEPVPVDVTFSMAGSDSQRILVLHCMRTDGPECGVMAVDAHMRIRFASCEVAALTGHTPRRLATMKLPQLLPPPYNVLHAKWLREAHHVPPPGSCRAGAAVHLLTEAGGQVPVRINVNTVDTDSTAPSGAGTGGSLHIVQVAKLCSEEELFSDKRLVLTANFSGRVVEVSPPDSTVFGFPAEALLGANLADCIDLFDDWRQHSGDGQAQLLMLALLDKEAEMPGTSWRVKVHAPDAHHAELPPLPGQARAPRKGLVGKTACLQVDLQEGGGGGASGEGGGSGGGGGGDGDEGSSSRILVSLWRRDLLRGVLELDEELTVRRASPIMALITGMPATSLLRQPLGRLLDLPPAASTWDELVAASSASGHKKRLANKSALKASGERSSVSPLLALTGPHPDSGTMRLLMQGVATIGPTGRPKITLAVQPDVTYPGAHANLMRVLKLTGVDAAEDSGHAGEASERAVSVGAPQHTWRSVEPATPRGGGRPRASSAQLKGRSGRSLAGVSMWALDPSAPPSPRADEDEAERCGHADEEAGAGAPRGGRPAEEEVEHGDLIDAAPVLARLHRQATSRSEFVQQWVKSLSNQVGEQQPSHRPSGLPDGAAPPLRLESRLEAAPEAEGDVGDGDGDDHRQADHDGVTVLVEGQVASPQGLGPAAEAGPDGLAGQSGASGGVGRQSSREVSSPQKGAARPEGRGKAEDADDDGKSSENDASSVGEGSQAASAISGVSDASSATEILVDARRGRLHRALTKLLLGPSLLTHIDRLHLHSYGLVAAMFLTHLLCYIVLTRLIERQHSNVYKVLSQAMAMDRCQLTIVRAMIGAFCSGPGILPVSACDRPLDVTLTRLRTAVDDMEQFHQGIYLGFMSSKVTQLDTTVYNVWTAPKTLYNFYTDTTPQQVVEQRAGAWVLGNRFIAAAREALYFLPQLLNNYMSHRSYQFILSNGLGPLFEVYATSLDLLVDAAWNSVQKLRTELVVLLVVEAVAVQLCCTLWELLLVRRLERARLSGMLAMLGLPGPVLRQLVASDQRKILDDSDDEVGEEDSVAGDEEERGRGGAASGSGRALALDASAPADEKAPAQPAGQGGAVGWHSSVPETSGTSEAAKTDGARSGPEDQGRQLAGRTFKQIRGRRKAARGAAGAAVVQGLQILQMNGKALLPSHRTLAKFMVPFLLWNTAVLLVYGISLGQLDGMQGPLASLNMAARVTYRYTRVRALALAFVVEPLPLRPALRGTLARELDLFDSEYNALMYGGRPTSMTNSTFQHAAPAGTFESADFARKFFTEKGCLRYDQSLCFPLDSPYYEVTHNGLDVLVRRMVSEMRLLTLDADEDVAYNGTRYTFMAAVAGNDLYEGMQQATQLFVDYSISRYNQVAKLHEVLLIVSVFLVIGFLVFLLWPHSRRVLRDASRQSGLLSLVPPEMDVRGHVRTVFRRTGGAVRRG